MGECKTVNLLILMFKRIPYRICLVVKTYLHKNVKTGFQRDFKVKIM